MKNYVQEGDVLTLTASRAVLSGEGMLRGATFGVAVNDVANGVAGEFLVRGVITLPKVSAQAQTEGAIVYWDNSAFNVTTTSSGNTKIGIVAAVGGLANPSATGTYRIAPAI
jgi:predicted RecA/RadA family phage recombinase